MTNPIRVSDPIIGPPRGSVDTVMARLRPVNPHEVYANSAVHDYVREVFRLAPLVGIDPIIVISQALIETGNFGAIPGAGATAWLERRNPGSLGITSTGKPGEPDVDHGHSWKDGTDAARGHLVHLLAYLDAERQTDAQFDEASDLLNKYKHLDPRYALVYEGRLAHTVRLLSDLGSGRWAADSRYAEKIAARGNQLFPNLGTTPTPPKETPMPITYHRVPHPGYLDRPIHKPAGQGWDNLGKRQPKFVVLHRMIGSLFGTDGYFRMAGVNALTDYGVGVKATDGEAQAGVIIRWNDPTGYQSGWASGPVNGAYGDGLAIVNKYGINAVNRDGVSIEISGNYDTPLDPVAFEEIARLMAYWWDQMRIPHTSAPINPATGISAVLWHQELTLGTGKICPGPVVMKATNDLIARATAILKGHQEGGTVGTTPAPSVFPKPVIPDFLGDRTKQPVVDYGGTDLVLVDDRYKALKTTGVYQRASRDAQKLRSDLKPGTEFAIAYVFLANGELWGISTFGSRIPLRDAERVSDAA